MEKQKLMPYTVESCGITDKGLVRDNNEDVWGQAKDRNFFVLADGMGGHRAGEVAAREAVNMLCKKIVEERLLLSSLTTSEITETLSNWIFGINETIFALGQSCRELNGMGTTICCAYCLPEEIILAHVGDSRIYRLREGELTQMTEDHSLLSEMIHKGKVSKENSDEFMYKNIITRAIGTDPTVEPEVSVAPLREYDQYLLCSDGLTDHLSNEEIAAIMREYPKLEECAHQLVDAAKFKGGQDNITVLLIHVTPSHE
ncbi:MAG: Stp1/IreP family PP2C-type Ser/Thr phosphatase [Chlamydiales bacterium]